MANGSAVFGWCGGDDPLCDQVQLAQVGLGNRPEKLTGHVCGIGQSDAPGEQGLQSASRSQHTGGHSLSERVGGRLERRIDGQMGFPDFYYVMIFSRNCQSHTQYNFRPYCRMLSNTS